MTLNYEDLCMKLIEEIKLVADFVRGESCKAKSVVTKGKHDFVTSVDSESERLLVDALSKLMPNAGFIAEEGTSSKKGDEYNWIIDPIDGTTNFIHNIYPHAISVALSYNNKVVVGVVYEIGRSECFYAWKDGGAYLDGNKIKVSTVDSVDASLIGTGFPYNNFTNQHGFMLIMDHLMQNSKGLRRLGSAATDLAYVACGRFDAFFERDLKPYDVAAGSLIVQEAGGKCCDFNGKSDFINSRQMIATNKRVHGEFVKLISSNIFITD